MMTIIYEIHLSQSAYRDFESECNLSGLDHDQMIMALLRVYRQHVLDDDFLDRAKDAGDTELPRNHVDDPCKYCGIVSRL